MTEEELEKVAGEYAKPFYNMTRYDYVEERTHVKEAYIAGAEPREKRIAELEKENAELKEKLEIEQNDRGDWFWKAVTKDRQFNKAKEIIKRQMKIIDDIRDAFILGDFARETIKEAEDFIKE